MAGTLSFDVVVDNAVQGGFSVDYSFIDGTATGGGVDYDSSVGTLNFAGTAGEIQTITLNITNDLLLEADETFTVNLTSSNALVNDADTAIGTITDNETANAVLSVTTQGDETGPQSIVYTVTLDKVNDTGTAITFDLADLGTGTASAGSDYALIPGGAQISIADGATTGTYTVTVTDDALLEATETVDAQISNPSDAAVTITGATATANITDNDTVTVTISATDAAAAETGSNPGQFTVDLGTINNTGTPITVNYSVSGTATAGGTDYTSLSGSVQIAAGAQTATIDVSGIVDDVVVEGNETVIVTLTGTSDASVGVNATPATVTIADNDTATLTVGDVTVNEAAGTLSFDVVVDNAVQGGFSVDYSFTDGTASGAGVDYDSSVGTLNFAGTAGEIQTITLNITNDLLLEADETFTVNLTSSNALVNDADTAIGTITDNDTATVTISATDAAAAEAGSDPGQFTVDLGTINNTGTPITVNYSVSGTATAGGTDYTSLSGSVQIAAGAQTATIDVSGIVDDVLVEGNETVIVTLTGTSDAAVGVNGTPATVTIADNDTPFTAALSVTTNGIEGGTDIVYTVTLSGTNNTGSDLVFDLADLGTGTASAGADYTAIAVGATITVTNGASTGSYTVTVSDDALLEALETLDAQISAGNAFTAIQASIGTSDATATITDNETATVTISATDAAAAETGSNPGQFTVDLGTTNNTGTPITVNYTVSGTATAGGTDYTSLSGSVQIAAGAQTATIDVSGIVDDLVVEGNETVIVTLTGTSDAAVGVNATPATVTIADNDTATLTVGDVTVNEAAGTLSFDVVVNNAVQGGFSVDYSFTDGTASGAGVDYDSSVGTLNFAGTAGEIQTITLNITNDLLLEADETFTVNLTSSNALVNDADTAIGTITDNDTATVTISATDAAAAETGSNPGQFTVDLGTINNTGTPITVNYSVSGTATAGGTDYTSLSGSVQIAAGAQTATIDVSGIVDDLVVEGNETVIVTLTGTSDAAVGVNATPATVTIADNDTATLTVNDVTVDEDAGTLSFDVVVNNAVQGGFSVDYSFIDGTATGGGVDYDSSVGTLNFAGTAGEIQTITVSITDDLPLEADETFTVNLTSSNALVNDADTAIGTITDNETANAVLSVTTQGDETGPQSIVYTVTLDKVNNTGTAITFDLADLGTGTASAGSDYALIPGGAQISIADGATTGTYTVTVTDDALLEATETVDAQISNPSDAAVTITGATATANITDNDTATVTISATDAAAAETGSNPGQFTVDLGTINNTGTPITVNYSVSGTATAGGTDYTSLSGSVQIAAGAQTATIDVSGIVDDLVVEGNETVIVTLTGTSDAAVGVNATPATVTIADNDTATLTVGDVTVNEAAGTLSFDVVVNNAVQGGFSVDYSFIDGTASGAGVDYDSSVGTLNFAGTAGEIQTITLNITNDLLLEADETFTVNLTSSNALVNDADTAIGTITDNDTATVTISATDAAAAEAGSDPGQFTVDLGTINNTGTPITVNYSVSGTATAGGTDYTSLSGSVQIAAGAQTATIDVSGIVDDVLVEGNETVIVTLTGTSDAAVGVNATPATVTIADNDTPFTAALSVTTNGIEGGTDIVYTVTLSGTNNTGSDLVFDLADLGTGTASAGADYTAIAVGATITVTNGASTGSYTVTVSDDALLEALETLDAQISAGNAFTAIQASIGTSDATATITDNETATVTISATDAAAAETGSNPGQFTVDLGTTNNTGTPITVNYTVSGTATAGGTDYTSLSGSVQIAAGAQTATIDVSGIVDDLVVEGNETVIVTLTGTSDAAVGVNATPATVTIADNDTATLTVGDVTVNEAAGTLSFDVVVNNAVQGGFSVDYSFTDGTASGGGVDYDSSVGTLNFAGTAGETQTITLNITNDLLLEAVGGPTRPSRSTSPAATRWLTTPTPRLAPSPTTRRRTRCCR